MLPGVRSLVSRDIQGQWSGTWDLLIPICRDSNAHSYSMSSHLCPENEFRICLGRYDCDPFLSSYDDVRKRQCDPYGCNYNPFRMGATEFYGKGKLVDTSKKFTYVVLSLSRAPKQTDIRSVITRFDDARVYQIFIQNGKRIDAPAPEWDGLPKEDALSADICSKSAKVFEERDRFAEGGGWNTHKEVLSRPMVLSLSINTDVSKRMTSRIATKLKQSTILTTSGWTGNTRHTASALVERQVSLAVTARLRAAILLRSRTNMAMREYSTRGP